MASISQRARHGSPGALGILFQRALQLSGIGVSGITLGCGSSEPVLTQDGYRLTDTRSGTFASEPGFEPLACDESEYPGPLYLDGLQPDEPVDGLELWSDHRMLERRGTPCANAEALVACQTEFAALPIYPNFYLGQVVQVLLHHHLRATRGSEVLRVGTSEELRAFLGEIDSRGDAQIWVASQNYQLVCGTSGSRAADSGGFDVLALEFVGCSGRTRHLLHVAAGGELTTLDRFVERAPEPGCVIGRRPEGLAEPATPLRSSLGEFFSRSAALEATSVPAFFRLARELLAHGAPSRLASLSLGSAADEVRHAREVGRLARAFGGGVRSERVPVGSTRNLEAVALENAVEGCVRETYGALVAEHQARRATDARVHATYRRIAQDETRHAALSWQIARWAEARLAPASRRRVDAARSAAAAALCREVRANAPSPIDGVAGLPSPGVGAALADQLERSLWTAATQA
jgi:rubrerythrin